MQSRKQCCQICLLFSGIVLICIGASIIIFFEPVYEFVINYNLKFAPGKPAYDNWLRSPPVQTDYYFFNWTNAGNINASVKPEFSETGPYRFYEIKGKANVTWNENFVEYATTTTAFFDGKPSDRNLSDVITTINPVALSISYSTRFQNFWAKKLVSFGLSSKIQNISITKSVGELLYDGYDDPILGLLSKIMSAPKKGGFMFGRNGTAGLDGTYAMYYKNDEKFGTILRWNGESHMDYYKGNCNYIGGSAGEFLPLNRRRDRILLYSSDLCKTLVLNYVEDVTVKGVKGFKYSAEYGFDNGTEYPENSCFCTGECMPTGVFNVSSCRLGSPTMLSFPHFFNADPIYRDSVKGMRPNKTLHEFYMIVEPKAGIIMEVQAPMQVNMLLQPVSNIRLFQKVPKIVMPIFYVVHTAHLSDEIAEGLRFLQNLPDYGVYFLYSEVILGCIISAIGVCWIVLRHKSGGWSKKNKTTSIILPEQVPLNEKNTGIGWR
ncbi:unnamed protein product [Phyllotreta striolata]|uniref:Protein croquemort-like n=1 Tax=Phyllotreta striolata TaxID=444603 RepID=A0A9N9TPP4_PHYSR|nr:unnamed protein product [Phyllotreta striolata]